MATAACAERPEVRLFHSHFARTRMLLVERVAEWLVALQRSVTCLVFRRRASDLWAGRGSGTSGHPSALGGDGGPSTTGATAIIDVRSVVDRKIAAMAAHRTQYPIEPDMFPRWMLEEMMGYEHFVQVQPAILPATDLFA